MGLIKAMGYGLRGLELNKSSEIVDSRINTESLLLDYDREDDATVRNFVRSTLKQGQSESDLDAILKGWHWGHVDPESTDPFEAVQHFPESPVEDTLILRPVGEEGWTRRNSLMDVYIDQANGHEGEDHVSLLRGGIYPYENRFMDTETFTQVNWDIIGEWIRSVNNDDSSFTEMFAQEAAKELGWGNLTNEDLKKRIVPMPPPEIIQLAEFGKLFTNPETVYELRPMIVTVRR